jgi:hypothetical protein
MRLSEFKKKFSLHDSAIDSWHYNPADQTLIARVQICDQPGYEEVDDSPVSGILKFTEVTNVHGDCSDLHLDGHNTGGEILTFEVESNSSDKNSESFKLVLQIENYKTRSRDTIVVTGIAEDLSFIRDTRE